MVMGSAGGGTGTAKSDADLPLSNSKTWGASGTKGKLSPVLAGAAASGVWERFASMAALNWSKLAVLS